ncbi:MAG: hypothetical protein XE08_0257 [Parcubacteria bacterium 32_520]|nr:MAG: hypothetical protein XE08_0257 [Parcubacteria bacterium 32_520]
MNLLNKKIWVFIGIFLSLIVFPIEKSFASTSSTIKVNGIKVDITRDLGEEEETYTIVTNDILKSFSLKFDENNQITLEKIEIEGVASWNVTLTYGEGTYSEKIDNETKPRVINDGIIAVQSLSKDSISFSVSKDLADRIFNKMLVNHDPFTLTASSTGGKNITVIREKFNEDGKDKDKYTFSSNEALKSVEVRDGIDNIIINYITDSNNNYYEVSGQYKEIELSKSAIVSGVAKGEIDYNNIKVVVEIGKERKTIILSSDHETIERVAQMILDDKRNITETTISPGETYKIVSNSNLSTINISGNGGKVKFMVDDSNNSSIINKEITVNYSGNKVVFPEGTKITGPSSGWNGEMSLPKIETIPTITLSVSGHNVNVLQTITIGGEGDFIFDKPVHLIFSDQAGKRVGFIKDGSFTEIQDCDGTNNIPAGKEDCKYYSRLDLIVLTKHFTEFVVFTATPISSGGGGGPTYTFSNVSADVQSNQVVITFNVSPASSAFLRYGTVQGGPYTELTETESKSSHSFTLTGLSSGTTYYYKVGASSETSPEYSFTYIETETQSGGSTIPTPIVVETESQTIKGDLTGDGVVDEYDFSLLMANWGKVGSNISDLNDDGVVDEYDFSLLMANWTI